MNKLVIIGNGFDIAHGLQTSYGSFLKNFWSTLKGRYKEKIIVNILYINPMYEECIDGHIESFEIFKKGVVKYCLKEKINFTELSESGVVRLPREWYNDSDYGSDESFLMRFKNEFFYKLCRLNEVQNWVDIEDFYYQTLKEISEGVKELYGNKYKGNVETLNKEFEEVKNLLEIYLYEEVVNKHDFRYDKEHNKILSLFKNAKDYTYNEFNKIEFDSFFKEFRAVDYEDLGEYNKELIRLSDDHNNNKVNDLLFLDFNYTPTVDVYVKELNSYRSAEYPKTKHISIHGKLKDISNPINFGFGDEMDKYYNILEDTNNNEYLRNIKSFQYLNNNNYRRLLEWIESAKFQVIIMGHSCGLSDRTMLNTIFEHDNCRSIKVLYYQKEKESIMTDNYTNIIQNISRHFKEKALMRTKIVDKTLCQPLPQECRFFEKN